MNDGLVGSVVFADKADARIVDSVIHDDRDDLFEFLVGIVESLATRGGIEKQILDENLRAGDACTRNWPSAATTNERHEFSVGIFGFESALLAGSLGQYRHVGDVADARKCLASKAVRGNGFQILVFPQFTRGEALADDIEVLLLYAVAVVLDDQLLQSAAFARDLNDRSACVQRVFYQLFHCVCWPMDYLSRCDPVDHFLI